MRNYKEEIGYIQDLIANLNDKLKDTEKEYIDSLDDFNEKFTAWANSSLGKHDNWIPQGPLLRKWIDNMEFNRYQTVDIMDYLSDDFYLIYHPEEIEQSEYFDQEDHKKIVLLAKEIMKNNIKSFTLDW